MSITHLLQDFGTAIPGAEPVALISQSEREAQNIAQYERGYAAGWEDSLQLQVREKSHLSKALMQNLQDLEFTFAEAHQQMIALVAPIVQSALEQLLPDIMMHSIGPTLVSEVEKLLGSTADFPAIICFPPGQSEAARSVIEQALGGTVRIVEDPGLGDGQVILKVGQTERIVELQSAIEEVRTVLAGFVFEASAGAQHG